MYTSYDDILALTAEPPKWWDECAVPRFCNFEPSKVANIYCDEVALVEITCQGCRRAFQVAFSRGRLDDGDRFHIAIPLRQMHYGDPPNVGCCGSGPTMNSEPRRVVEYWARGFANPMDFINWKRDRSLEIDVTPEWVAA